MSYDELIVDCDRHISRVMAICIDKLLGVISKKYGCWHIGSGLSIYDMFNGACLKHVVNYEFNSGGFNDESAGKLKLTIDNLFRDVSSINDAVRCEIESDESIREITTEYLGYVE